MIRKGFVDERILVNYGEYKVVYADLMARHIRQKVIRVPYSLDLEQRLLEIMSKSNHWLCRPIKRYVSSTRTLSYFCFSRAKVLVERRKGKSYVDIAFPKSLANFKYVVARELYVLDLDMKIILRRKFRNGDFIRFVSLYKEYHDGKKDISFWFFIRTKMSLFN